MKTKYSHHQIKIRLAKGKMNRLELKHPDFDFRKAVSLQKSIEKYHASMKDLIYASVNADYCKDKDFRKRCESCECWKRTKANWIS